MWANYHMHNRYCDGIGELTDYANEAINREMISIGFSSHAPLPFPCKWSMNKQHLGRYLEEASHVRESFPSLQIYTGLEVDFIAGMAGPSDYDDLLDYTIGSIHFVDQFPDGRFWEIDGSHESFVEGLSVIFKSDVRQAIERYFELTRQMLEQSRPAVVGHLDKIKIQNRRLFDESDQWYRDAVTDTLDVIQKTGVIVEVNTRGQYLGKSTTTYPSPWILELVHQRNIPVTISSDAHKPGDIINGFPSCASMLFNSGFRNISVLLDGSWTSVKLTANGLSL